MLKKILIPPVITLILVELILWLGFPQGTYPAIDIHMTQDIPGLSKNVHFTKNKFGLRTNTIHTAKKEKGSYRIIVIGASTAEQATHDNDKTWAIQLEQLLQKKFPNQKIQLGIYATGGAKTHELLRWVNLHLLDLEPDLVITLLGINNLATDLLHHQKSPEALTRYINAPPSTLERFCKFSQIARYLRNIKHNSQRLEYTRNNNGDNFDVAGVHSFRRQYRATPLLDNPPPFPTNVIRQQSDWLLDFLDAHKIQSLTLSQPSLFKPELDTTQVDRGFQFKTRSLSEKEANERKAAFKSLWFITRDNKGFHRLQPSEMLNALNSLNNTQQQVAELHGRAYFPLHRHLQATTENFFDDCHFTDLGSSRIAELLVGPVAKIIESQR
jgi:lysophospholipase L1-like esterase